MGCPVSPKNFEEDLPKEGRAVIEKIQELSSSGRARSLLVGSRSWRACLNNKGIDAGESPPLDDGVICDVLLFSSNLEGLHLFTLCNRDEDDEFCRTYNFSTTKALKKALVVQGGCSEKFYITPHVVNCLAPIEQQISLTYSSPYPVGYEMTQHRGKINQILTSLINVLASIPSALSSKMGVKFLHLLTEEQFKLLYEAIDSYPELWIRGMAGTGKTVVAIEFIRKLFERDHSLKKEEVIFVCENVGLKEHVSNHDLCKCYTRKGFMSMPEDLSGKVKHIVMDEVQSFRDEDRRPPERESWLQRARRLVRQHSVDNPGFLWLFNDNHQVNHSYETGIPPVKEQKPFIKLRKVIRNSKRIVQYVASMTAFNEKEATDYVVGHDFEGDDVWIKDYKEGAETPSLKEVIQSLHTEGYCEEDITVLYGKEQLIPKNLGNSLNITTIVGAEKNDSKYLVVSTLRKYSGLERPVVILVNLLQMKSLPYRSILDRAIYCCATRAMVKLVILREIKLGIHQSN